jgi:hypothetical protein
MKKQDWLNILFTFIVGVFVGFYVYVTGFAPTVEKIETTVEEIGETLIVTGEAYGGCDRVQTCPSFNIADDGTYRYSYTPRGATTPVLREGALPLSIQRNLKKYATKDTLEQFSKPVDPVMCESYVDGIDVRYVIELEGELYTLDSCGTNVDVDSKLWQTLSGLWSYFDGTDRP